VSSPWTAPSMFQWVQGPMTSRWLLAAPPVLALLSNSGIYQTRAVILSAVLLLWSVRALQSAFWTTDPHVTRAVSALVAGIVWHAAVNFWAPVLLSESSLTAAREGTQLPTIAPNLYLTVLAVQVVAALVLIFVTKGKLGYPNTLKS